MSLTETTADEPVVSVDESFSKAIEALESLSLIDAIRITLFLDSVVSSRMKETGGLDNVTRLLQHIRGYSYSRAYLTCLMGNQSSASDLLDTASIILNWFDGQSDRTNQS